MNLQEYKRCVDDLDITKLQELKQLLTEYTDIIILGNGGSNAIASHIAQDYSKILGKRALSFSDSARLSCYANDYGWENAYTEFVKQMSTKQTLIILISSSGNSQNILRVADFCTYTNQPMVILSGFLESNSLKTTYCEHSVLDFWVNSMDYGVIECIHELILHSVL